MKRPSVVIMLAILTACAVRPARAQAGATAEPPHLINAAEVQDSLRRHYPIALRRRGVAGVAQLRLFINARGAADSVQLRGATGSNDLDKAAVAIARILRFSPAQVDGEARGAWIDMPITFQPPARIPSPSVNAIALANKAEVEQAIRRWRPKGGAYRDIGWEAEFWVEIDSAGSVVGAELKRQNCIGEFNRAGHEIAYDLRFAPATEGAGAIAGWTTVTLYLNTLSDSGRVVLLEGENASRQPPDAAKPTGPVLQNRAEIMQLMQKNYPKPPRTANVGGAATVWLHVDEKGRVTRRRLKESTGDCQFDKFVLDVGRAMNFSPARLNGQSIAAWVEMPVSLRAW